MIQQTTIFKNNTSYVKGTSVRIFIYLDPTQALKNNFIFYFFNRYNWQIYNRYSLN